MKSTAEAGAYGAKGNPGLHGPSPWGMRPWEGVSSFYLEFATLSLSVGHLECLDKFILLLHLGLLILIPKLKV